MGEVYRATDSRLGRDVAIKVLPEAMRESLERGARFEREAKLLASINHPNIATIHGLEDLAGSSAIVMELVDGPSLDELIAQGPFAIADAARMARQIADGLSSAHARGIVHRDLKPSNVCLAADGRVKILDLGLARMVASDAGETLGHGAEENAETLALALETRQGTILGTAAYMSPEQAVGAPVDARTDVWAFGAVLFEMLSGRRAFPGRTVTETLAAVLRGEVEWQALPADTPREVLQIIKRCLVLEAANRLSDLGEARDALRPFTDASYVATPHVSTETKSIIVLPFENLSPDSDTDYFSDGLTDEIITDLSQVQALRVISRSSAMRLKDDTRGLAAISRDLACQYVLEGSVRRAADSLRITARLVDAPNDVQLWADKYGGTLDDVFDFQERVSRSIVDALEIRLSPQEAKQLAERPIDDVRAQDSYLRARSEIWSFMPGSLDLAISHLDAALRLIGDNALIYQGLGEAYFQYVNIGAAVGREEELIQKAQRCADKIFELEAESPRGYLVKAQIQMARGDILGSSRSLRRVLEAFPKEILALQLYTHALGWLGGKPDAAAPYVARLLDIDPLNAMSLLMSAMVPLFAGRFAEAVERGKRMFDLDPVTPVWRANYVMALGYARQFDEAEALTESVAAEPDSDIATWQMGIFRAAWREDRNEVLRLADGPYQQVAAWDAEVPWFLAVAHAAVGVKEEALLWLDRAIDHGMINYPFLSEHDWFLDTIRGEPRFTQAMDRARRAWQRLEV
jgi:serine/threonine protein kinase/Flp pilus assembly protein TadD